MTDKIDTMELREKLNGETGKLQWSDLQRHFASGAIIKVAASTDLVDVAVSMVQNDTNVLKAGMSSGTITHASVDDARNREQSNLLLWVVVIAPWVLVQEVVEH